MLDKESIAHLTVFGISWSFKSRNNLHLDFLISDINGKPKIEKNIFLNEGLNEVSFEISLPSGIYFLTNNKSRDGTFIEKIFIK